VETSVEERDQIFGDVRVGGVVAFLALFVVAREEVVDGEVDIEVGALQLAYYQVPALALEDDLGLRDEFLWDVGRRHSHHGAAAARAAGADDDRGAATTYQQKKNPDLYFFNCDHVWTGIGTIAILVERDDLPLLLPPRIAVLDRMILALVRGICLPLPVGLLLPPPPAPPLPEPPVAPPPELRNNQDLGCINETF
jgi:hypothetical protein